MSLSEVCWLWTGIRKPEGYGQLWHNGGIRFAHRVIYERLVGPIPAGLELDHLCRQRGCVNPAHLRPVTRQGNALAPGAKTGRVLAALQSSKTHCPKGHPYDEENTYRKPSGWRCCRTCRSRSSAEAYRRQRGLLREVI